MGLGYIFLIKDQTNSLEMKNVNKTCQKFKI